MAAFLFDESILVRELRRWKNQKRWVMVLAALGICGMMAMGLVLQIASGIEPSARAQHAQPLFEMLLGTILLTSAGLAFVQSMQVLRNEALAQTLEGLFLTLQKSRAVILSVVACGVISGAVIPVVMFPVILFAGTALGVPLTHLAAVMAVAAMSVLVASSIGSLWFFVSQNHFTVNTSPLRIGLNAAAIALIFYLSVQSGGLNPASAQFTGGVFAVLLICVLLGMTVWAGRTIGQEARHMLRPGRMDADGRPEPIAAAALTGVGLLCLLGLGAGVMEFIAWVPQQSQTMICPAEQSIVWLNLLWPVNSVTLLVSTNETAWSLHNAVLSSASVILTISFWTLISIGTIVCACRLYRRLRETPEEAVRPGKKNLKVVDIGLDQWQGFKNPVLTRELRTRLRSGDARLFIAIAAVMSATACIVPLVSAWTPEIIPTEVANYARQSFIWVAMVQLGIACLIGPGVGAEALVAEREHKTYEMVLASQLTTSQILWGKIWGCALLMLLLISPSFPLLAFTAFLHAVSIYTVLVLMFVLLVFALSLSVVCVCVSAVAKSSVSAKWTAYMAATAMFGAFGFIPFAMVDPSHDQSAGIIGPVLVLTLLPVLWAAAVRALRRKNL